MTKSIIKNLDLAANITEQEIAEFSIQSYRDR